MTCCEPHNCSFPEPRLVPGPHSLLHKGEWPAMCQAARVGLLPPARGDDTGLSELLRVEEDAVCEHCADCQAPQGPVAAPPANTHVITTRVAFQACSDIILLTIMAARMTGELDRPVRQAGTRSEAHPAAALVF